MKSNKQLEKNMFVELGFDVVWQRFLFLNENVLGYINENI